MLSAFPFHLQRIPRQNQFTSKGKSEKVCQNVIMHYIKGYFHETLHRFTRHPG